MDCDTCGNRCKAKCAEYGERGKVLLALCKFSDGTPEKKTVIADPGIEACPYEIEPCLSCHDISVTKMSEWKPE